MYNVLTIWQLFISGKGRWHLNNGTILNTSRAPSETFEAFLHSLIEQLYSEK
jgi:hypothetical protein